VLGQIGSLAAYTMELMDGLFRISQETQNRIEKVAERTQKLGVELERLETESMREADKTPLVDLSVVSSLTQKREVKVPHIFTRITNAEEILAQYNNCTPPPFLNKIDSILGGEQCSHNFSYPRFFFNEWYKSEVKRQEKKKEEKKKRRKERREKREAKSKEGDKKQKKLSAKKMKKFKDQYKNETINGMTIAPAVTKAAPRPLAPKPPPPRSVAPKPPPPPPQAYRRSRTGVRGSKRTTKRISSGNFLPSAISEQIMDYPKMEIEENSPERKSSAAPPPPPIPPSKPPPGPPPAAQGTTTPPRSLSPPSSRSSPGETSTPSPPKRQSTTDSYVRDSSLISVAEEEEEEVEEEATVDPMAIFNTPLFAKYQTMKKINLPEAAIRHKMEQDKVKMSLVDLFCPNTVYQTPSPQDDDEGHTTQDDSSVGEEDNRPDGDPKDWEETVNDETGDIYYINKITWESSWVPPKGWEEYQEGLQQENKANFLNSIATGTKLRRISVTPGSRVVSDPRNDVMAGIRKGISLKKAAPLPPKPVEARDQMISALKNVTLKSALQHVEINKYDENERMDDAVAKLLANRAAIAGESDSESDSDSDYDFDSDEDYP